jgi:hypothetical protein
MIKAITPMIGKANIGVVNIPAINVKENIAITNTFHHDSIPLPTRLSSLLNLQYQS